MELRELIVDEEVKFKSAESSTARYNTRFKCDCRRILSEIEEIRSGLWDNKIKAKITGVPIDEPTEDVGESILPAESPDVKAVSSPTCFVYSFTTSIEPFRMKLRFQMSRLLRKVSARI
jgi:hypothetical protein